MSLLGQVKRMLCESRHIPRNIKVPIVNHIDGSRSDAVSVEEPLEIWLAYKNEENQPVELSLSITMRTPGDDFALAVGFLFAEGIIKRYEDISQIEMFGPVTEPLMLRNQIRIHLKSGEGLAEKNFQRYFLSNSSCGVCGKSSIDALQMLHQPDIQADSFKIKEAALKRLPDNLRASQQEFEQTGGLHAVALANAQGEILLSREDIGRHNAMDKVIGQLLIDGELNTSGQMILVSGRASFELVQKALMADIPFFAAIGAPSSAAVDLASQFDMTLVGFLRDTNYNVYHKAHRIEAPE